MWIERECDRERAAIVLRDIETDSQRTGSRLCDACHEESPANFDLCWNCGGTL